MDKHVSSLVHVEERLDKATRGKSEVTGVKNASNLNQEAIKRNEAHSFKE